MNRRCGFQIAMGCLLALMVVGIWNSAARRATAEEAGPSKPNIFDVPDDSPTTKPASRPNIFDDGNDSPTTKPAKMKPGAEDDQPASPKRDAAQPPRPAHGLPPGVRDRAEARRRIAFVIDGSAAAAPQWEGMLQDVGLQIEWAQQYQQICVYCAHGEGDCETMPFAPANALDKVQAQLMLQDLKPGGDCHGLMQGVEAAHAAKATLMQLFLSVGSHYAGLAEKIAKANADGAMKIEVHLLTTDQIPVDEAANRISELNHCDLLVTHLGTPSAPSATGGALSGFPSADFPTSPKATDARDKFGKSITKAQEVFTTALGHADDTYLAELQKVLAAAMKAPNLEAANWSHAEMQRTKTAPMSPIQTPPDFAPASLAATRRRHVIEMARDNRTRDLELARRQYLTDLGAAKKASLTSSKDLDEANRIEKLTTWLKTAPLASEPANSRKTTTVDLLKLADLDSRFVVGDWKLNEGTLTTEAPTQATLQYAYDPPSEYDYEITFLTHTTHPESAPEVWMHASSGEKSFTWMLGRYGNHYSYVVGIGAIPRGIKFWPLCISQSAVHKATVKVRKDSLEFFLDGVSATRLTPRSSDMQMRLPMPAGQHLGLWILNGGADLQSISVTEISGPGHRLELSHH